MSAIARDTQLSQTRAKEKKTVAAGRITCRCYRRTFKNVLGEKSAKAACGVSVARRGFPAARRRDRNRSACRSARSHALCVAPPRARPSLAAGRGVASSLSHGPAPHASHGRPRFPAVPLEPATWPYLWNSSYQLPTATIIERNAPIILILKTSKTTSYLHFNQS